jgi:phosphoglycolate phosphatase
VPLDGLAFSNRLGPPLEHEFARYGLDAATTVRLVARYRDLYQEIVLPMTVALPGAMDALQSVTERGGHLVVVTGKYGPNAVAHLEALRMDVSIVIGQLWAGGKAVALREHRAEVYVGDHTGDVLAAREADAMAIAVATGPISPAGLTEAGADVVLRDLTEFPTWLDSYLMATVH